MNLQEQTNRIKQMMGVINENKVVDIIQDMGLYDAIRYFGGYDNLTKMMGDYNITRKEKINAIIERVTDIHQSIGDNDSVEVWITDIGREPIEYNGLNNAGTRYDYQLIEVLYRDGVIIYGYRDKYSGQDMGSFERDYEDLSDEELEEIINTIMT
jgi:hypothetical protein